MRDLRSCRAALLFSAASLLSAACYDVLIRNARVIDGSGNAWFRADVAVKDGHIAAIGRLGNSSATRTIDARERVVAPASSMFTPISKAASKGIRAATTSCSTA